MPGTYDEDDDDVVVIEETPPKKVAQKSILGRKPKNLAVSDVSVDDLFNFDEPSRGGALRAKNQSMREPQRRRPIVQKIQPEQTLVNITLDRSAVQNKTTKSTIIDSDSDDDFSPQSRASTSKNAKAPSPKKRAQKRQIEPDQDDLFNFEAPKRSRQANNSTVNNLSKTLKSQSISSQLETVGTKRGNDQSADDLFSFGPKRSKIAEPKLRRNLRKEAEEAAEKSNSVIEINDTLEPSDDFKLDLLPGVEVGDGEWLSKDSITVKKESNDEEHTEPMEQSDPKEFFNVIPINLNLDDTLEVRGKSFKKKINFKKQTNIIEVQQLELHDCNMLYPTVKYDD